MDFNFVKCHLAVVGRAHTLLCVRPCTIVDFFERAKVLVIGALSSVLSYSTFSGVWLFGFWKNYRVFMSVKGNFSCFHCKIGQNYMMAPFHVLSNAISSLALNSLQVP